MAIFLGMDCKIYRNTGTYNVPVWNEVGNVRDVTLNLETATADATTRMNNGWRATVATLKDGSVEFEMLWDPTDGDFAAFFAVWMFNGVLDCLILDENVVVNGAQGLRADFAITNFTRSEPLEDITKAQVKMQPGVSTNAPVWWET